MLDWQKHTKLRIFIKTVCIVLIATFLSYDLSWAGATEVLNPQDQYSPQETQNIHPVEIPQELGTIKESYTSKYNPDKLVIHIQDAHANVEAQENEVELIRYLKDKYKINFVSVEGGFEDFDAEFFRAFPKDKIIRDKIAKYFLSKAFISGSDYLLITENRPPVVYGAEDRELYTEHLNTFKKNINIADSFHKSLEIIEPLLENLKTKYYSPDLIELDSKINDFQQGRLSLEEYLSYLYITSVIHNLNLSKFPSLSNLIELQELERKINFKEAESERQVLIDNLTKALSKQDLQDLIKKSLDFKDNKLSPAQYYSYLKDLTQKANIRPYEYKNFFLYIQYIVSSEDLDNSRVFAEIDAFTEDLKEKLITNPTQKDINSLTYIIRILKGLSNIDLAPKEYEYFKKNRNDFNSKELAQLFRRYIGSHSIKSLPTDSDIASLEKFYDLALERDRAIVSNSLNRLNQEYNSDSVILVAGGFHTSGITSILKEKDISYLVIAPNIKTTPDRETLYFSLLKDKRLPLQDVLNDPDTLQIINSISDPQARQLLITYWVARASRYYSLKELQTQLNRLGLSNADQQAVQLALNEISPETKLAKQTSHQTREPLIKQIPGFIYYVIQTFFSPLKTLFKNPITLVGLTVAGLTLGIPGISWAHYFVSPVANTLNAVPEVWTWKAASENTLWGIAQDILEAQGQSPTNHQILDKINEIVAANPNIANPNFIYPGQEINIPHPTPEIIAKLTSSGIPPTQPPEISIQPEVPHTPPQPEIPSVPHPIPEQPVQPTPPIPERQIGPIEWITTHPLVAIGIFAGIVAIVVTVLLIRKYRKTPEQRVMDRMLKSLRSDIKKSQSLLADTEAKVGKAQQELGNLSQQRETAQRQLNLLKDEQQKAAQDVASFTQQRQSLEQEVKELTAKQDVLVKELNDTQKELAEAKEALSTLQREIGVLEEQKSKITTDELPRLEQERNKLRQEIEELKLERKELEEVVQKLKAPTVKPPEPEPKPPVSIPEPTVTKPEPAKPPVITLPAPYAAMVFDIDNTITENTTDIDKDMLEQMLYFLREGLVIALVTAQGMEEVKTYIVDKVSTKDRTLLRNLVIYPAAGVQAYQFDEQGNLIEEPVYDVSRGTILSENPEEAKRVIRSIVGPKAHIHYRGGIITVSRIPDRAQAIDKLITAFKERNWSLVPRPVGRRTLQILVQGSDKGKAVGHFLKEVLSRRFKEAISANQVLIVGDSFYPGGLDLDMLEAMPEAHIVSVGGKPEGEKLKVLQAKGVIFSEDLVRDKNQSATKKILAEIKKGRAIHRGKPPHLAILGLGLILFLSLFSPALVLAKDSSMFSKLFSSLPHIPDFIPDITFLIFVTWSTIKAARTIIKKVKQRTLIRKIQTVPHLPFAEIKKEIVPLKESWLDRHDSVIPRAVGIGALGGWILGGIALAIVYFRARDFYYEHTEQLWAAEILGAPLVGLGLGPLLVWLFGHLANRLNLLKRAWNYPAYYILINEVYSKDSSQLSDNLIKRVASLYARMSPEYIEKVFRFWIQQGQEEKIARLSEQENWPKGRFLKNYASIIGCDPNLLENVFSNLPSLIKQGRRKPFSDFVANLKKANINAANALRYGVTFILKVTKIDKEFEEGLKILEIVSIELKNQGFNTDNILYLGSNSVVPLSKDFVVFKALSTFVIELAKNKQNPQELFTSISPWVVKTAKDSKQVVARLNIILKLILGGIHPTQFLIEIAEKTTSQAEVNNLVSQWQKMLADFRIGGLTFDPKNPLHVDLEYITFRQLAAQASQGNSYGSYIEIIRKFQTQTTTSNLNEHEQAEIKFAVYEAFRLLEFIIAVRQRAEQLGRSVWVVPNLSYGKFAVSPILDELAKIGIEVHYARVSSGKSHDNPTLVKPNLFSSEDYSRILREKPILIVVDGTQHLLARPQERKSSRYPDAYIGYRNFLVAIDEVLSEGKADRFLDKARITKEFLETLKGNPDYKELLDKLKNIAIALDDQDSPYVLDFWNPGGLQLVVREARKEIQDVVPVKPSDINSPTLIFVNVVLLDEDISQEIKDWAKPQSPHTPAYFDDNSCIQSTFFAINGRGIYLSHALEFEISKAAKELKSLYKIELPKAVTQLPLPDTARPGYEAMIFDLDGTLTDTLKPVEDSLLDKLLLLFNSGVLIAIVTSQSLEEVKSHVLDKISQDKRALLQNLFLYTARGAQAFKFNSDSNPVVMYDRSQTDLSSEQYVKLRLIVQEALGDLAKEVEVLDRQAQITIHLDKYKDKRDEIIQVLKQAIDRNNLPIDIDTGGRSTIHLVLSGVNKGEAVKHFLSSVAKPPTLAEPQGLEKKVDLNKLLIVGNRFHEGGSDRSMIIPGARVVSVGDKDNNKLPEGVEAYSDQGWRATDRLLAEIIHKKYQNKTTQIAGLFFGFGLSDFLKEIFSEQNLDTIGSFFMNAISGFLIISFLIFDIVASVRLFRIYRTYSKVKEAVVFMGPLGRFRIFREISSNVPWLYSKKIDPHRLLKDMLFSLGQSTQDKRLSEISDLITRLSKAKINPRHVLKYGLPPVSTKAKDKKDFIQSLHLVEKFVTLLNDKRFDVHTILRKIMPKLNRATRTLDEFNEAVLLGINLLKSGRNPEVALCQILPEIITYTHNFSEYRMALYAVYRLIVEGLEPTKYLVKALMIYNQEDMADKAVSDWQDLRRKFKSADVAFDPDDKLHVDLEYTTFRELVDRTLKQAHRYSYREYLSIIKNMNRQAAKVGLSRTEKTEIKYTAYEAFRLMQFILKVARQAKAIGRKVWVVPNLSYGRFAVSPILKDLAKAGIEVHYARIGSSESHDNPELVKTRLFNSALYSRIINEQPIIIVVDGTQHLLARPKDRKSARYPDAYVGYRNMIIAVNDIISRGKENVFKHLVKTRGRFIVRLRKSQDYRRLRRRLLRLYQPNPLQKHQLYTVEFWNPGGLGLAIREARQEKQRVKPVHTSRIQQPALIFVNCVLLNEDIPKFMRRWAAEGKKINHKPAYFDDTSHIQNIIFDVDLRGIHLSDRLYKQLRHEFKRIKSIYNPILRLDSKPRPVVSVPYKVAVLDLDGTLADNLTFVPRIVLEKLLYLLQSGVQVAIITTQSLKQIERYLLRIVPKAQRSLLQNLIIYPATGGQGFGFDKNGNLTKPPLYDVSNTHLTTEQNLLWRKIIGIVLQKYSLDKPLADEKGNIIAQPAAIIDGGAQIITRLNERKTLRDEIIQYLFSGFSEAGIPLTLKKIGRTSIRTTVKGIDKAYATKYHLQEVAKRLGYEVEPKEILVAGNSFDEDGDDRQMMIKGAKVVSVGHKPADHKLRKGIEFYPMHGWQGINYVLSEIINEIESHKKNASVLSEPVSSALPQSNQRGYVLSELLTILTGLGLIGLSIQLFVSSNFISGGLIGALGIIIAIIPWLKSLKQFLFKPDREVSIALEDKPVKSLTVTVDGVKRIFQEAVTRPSDSDIVAVVGRNATSRWYSAVRRTIKSILQHPITVYYPGACTDITHPLLTTDGDVFLFVDIGESKKSIGKLIGAISKQIKQSGGRVISSYIIGEDKGVINFELKGRNRVLYYYNNIDASNEDVLPQKIKKGFDVYIEKSLLTGYTGSGINKALVLPIAMKYLRNGGFILTDYSARRQVIDSRLKTVGIEYVKEKASPGPHFTCLTYFSKPEVDLNLQAEYIRQKYLGLKIGVVGAAIPTKEYSSDSGVELGRRLRRYIDEKGFIFTGGVAGVGVDVYKGICEENNDIDDRFFVLLPEETSSDFEYEELSPARKIQVEYIGRDMLERRIGIGKVADALIVLNGRYGTLHEAISALENGKKLIVLNHGGTGSLLYYAKANNLLSTELLKAGLKTKHLKNIILADIDHIEETLEEAQGSKHLKEKSSLILGDPMNKALLTSNAEGILILSPQALLAINSLSDAYTGLTLEIDIDTLIDTSKRTPQLKGLGFKEAVSALYKAQENKNIPEDLRIRLINLNSKLDRAEIIKTLGLTRNLLEKLVTIPEIPEDYLIKGLEPYLVEGSIRIVFEDNLRYWGNKIDVIVKRGRETEIISGLGLIVSALAKEPEFYQALPQELKEYVVAVTDEKGNITRDDQEKIKQLIFKPIEKTKVDTQYLEQLERANKELEGMV